jgi:hypothetical protein
LKLHLSAPSLLIGATSGILAALVCVGLTLRGLRKLSTRRLLAGQLLNDVSNAKRSYLFLSGFRLAMLFTVIGFALLGLAAARRLGPAAGFFGGGTAILIALLLYEFAWLKRDHRRTVSGSGLWPVARLGFRNTTHRPARTILCIALIASAVFIIVAVDSFRHRSRVETLDRQSGTGGFPLLADS